MGEADGWGSFVPQSRCLSAGVGAVGIGEGWSQLRGCALNSRNRRSFCEVRLSVLLVLSTQPPLRELDAHSDTQFTHASILVLKMSSFYDVVLHFCTVFVLSSAILLVMQGKQVPNVRRSRWPLIEGQDGFAVVCDRRTLSGGTNLGLLIGLYVPQKTTVWTSSA